MSIFKSELRNVLNGGPLDVEKLFSRKMHKRLGREDCTSFLAPLLRNKDFVPGMSHSIFDKWHKNGLRVIGDLFQNNTLMNFEQL